MTCGRRYCRCVTLLFKRWTVAELMLTGMPVDTNRVIY